MQTTKGRAECHCMLRQANPDLLKQSIEAMSSMPQVRYFMVLR